MRYLFTSLIVIFLACGSVSSQHALTGAWELLSTRGTDAEGAPFTIDTTSVREIKLITPTHYMLMAHDVVGDSLIFNRTYAGKVDIKGDQYIETPLMSSLQIVDGVKTMFTWRLEGDRFIQSGSVARPDGRTVKVELVFRKIKSPSWPQNPALGTWRILSSTLTTPEGKTHVEKVPEVEVMEIITPTHWMGISYRNNKFENALGGTYSLQQNRMLQLTLYAARPMHTDSHVVLELDRKGGRVNVNGTITAPKGRFTFEEVWEQME